MKLLAPAKINLFLKILGRRSDGYHDLSMVMEKISLCDEIVLEKIPNGIELVNPIPGVPTEKNLVCRAAQAFKRSGVRIHLTKKIPMGGGLGGGSSDAAAVLKSLNRLWELNWPTEKLAEVGVRLGADVPFFLYDGPAKVEGIGDRISPLERLPKLSIILINPGIFVSTPWAYSAWDESRSLAPRNRLTQQNHDVRLPAALDFGGIIKLLHNDFETVVFPKFPEIKEAKEKLLEVGAEGALMSGSGSSVFGLFETAEKRDSAFEKLLGRLDSNQG